MKSISKNNIMTKHGDKIARILSKLKKKPMTANEVIDSLYNDDIRNNGIEFLVTNRGWRYYVHLNKLFAPLERDYVIMFTGEYRLGETGKMEKVWKL